MKFKLQLIIPPIYALGAAARSKFPPICPNLSKLVAYHPSYNPGGCYIVGGACETAQDCSVDKDNPARLKKAQTLCKDKGSIVPVGYLCKGGFCRTSFLDEEGEKCNCYSPCGYVDQKGDMYCVNDRCQLPECGACNQKPKGNGCCAPGVIDHGGKKCTCDAYKDNCVSDNGFCPRGGTHCCCNGKCSSSCDVTIGDYGYCS